ncbi:MAG: HD domain-containing protein, partial [Acidobacteriaceae bacterium]|nr:HD domain-containing protein [Acidobacteriaceae bacterium]
HDKVIPKLVLREAQTLTQRLAEITRTRHAKFGNTVFHLEPNIKDMPGGLRDCNVVAWMSMISAMHKTKQWPESASLVPEQLKDQHSEAYEFLRALRCFLHFRHGRDDNTLTWDAQDAAAGRSLGGTGAVSTAGWMRLYFNRARAVHRTTSQLLDEVPAQWSSLYRQFQSWRSRVSNADFSVVNGLVYVRQPAVLKDPEVVLRLFHFIAHHGLKLSITTESQVRSVLQLVSEEPISGALLWSHLEQILVQPHAAEALRTMHSLGLLTVVMPELKPIDALVVRDYYHRYTVDEHSFTAIEALHRLSQSENESEKGFSELVSEIEQAKLLYLAILLHDTGKGLADAPHVQGSLVLTDEALKRLAIEEHQRDTVRFLVANHLEMSACIRRDIFDPTTVAAFAEKVGTPEHLKLLTLMTYADIKAVNPDALTPWKAYNRWQLYIATANRLNRSIDERLESEAADQRLAELGVLAAAHRKRLADFLEGLPKRYLQVHTANDALRHFEMAQKLASAPVQTHMNRARHGYALTVVTQDRPFLFARLAGTLAAWGMNIVKAEAFSNAEGTVIDSFYFTDQFRTLELNASEAERLEKNITAVVVGEADLDKMLRDRARADKNGRAKVKVRTSIDFDDNCSPSSTLVQVVTQDRVGLLHAVASCFARQNCNIEIALIDTEGQMAIDVFYLTSDGKKLSGEQQEKIRRSLKEELQF